MGGREGDAAGGADAGDVAGLGGGLRRSVWAVGLWASGVGGAVGFAGGGAGADRCGGGAGDGAADGDVLPPGNDVCAAGEYVERADGGGAGSPGGGDVLRGAGESLAGDAAGGVHCPAAAWDYLGDWAGERGADGGPAGSGAGVLGGFAGGGGVGVLYVGGEAVAWVGLGRCGHAAADCGDGALAGEGGGVAGGDGGDGDRCGAGRFPAGGES